MAFRSGNPALNPQYFQGGMATERMTLDGTINKTLALLGLVSIAAMLSYSIATQNPGLSGLLILGGGLGGFALALAVVLFLALLGLLISAMVTGVWNFRFVF